MEYKIIAPLRTKHVEPWAAYVWDNKVLEMSHPASEATVIRKAAEFGWFGSEEPNVDEMLPTEVVELGTKVLAAYSAAMGFDGPNSHARPRTTPKDSDPPRAN
jgi:hypothetical protein